LLPVWGNVIDVARNNDDDNDAENTSSDETNSLENGMDRHSQSDRDADSSEPSDSCNSDHMENVNTDSPVESVHKDNKDPRRASVDFMRKIQMEDEGLVVISETRKGNFIIKDGIRYRDEKILGQSFTQLCLPKGRRAEVLTMAHDTFGGSLDAKGPRNAFACLLPGRHSLKT
jgi:hypothetical protein